MIRIDKRIENGKAVTVLEGYLDTVSAPELEKMLENSLDGIQELIFDFEKLEYVSSRGLRVLLSANNAMAGQGKMIIRHVPEDIMETFEITGLTDRLHIE